MDCIQEINLCNSELDLVNLLNPVDKDAYMVKEQGKGVEYNLYYRCQRFYKLNFTNLLNNKKTIEIRSHKGTTDLREIRKWLDIWTNIFELAENLPLIS